MNILGKNSRTVEEVIAKQENFFGEKIFEDCEIAVKKFVTPDDQVKFMATIQSKIPERPCYYEFFATFVSLIFKLLF